MSLIERLVNRLQNHPKRVVFPEGADPRIIQAARQFVIRRMGAPVLLGDRARIKATAEALDINLEGVRVIEPSQSAEMPEYARRFQGLRRFRGLNQREVEDYLSDVNYFATMMLASGSVDALVSGATESASSALRPLLRMIPLQQGVQTLSSMTILEKEASSFGIEGALFLSDCAVIPEPSAEQLCDIALTTAKLANHLTGQHARVAMLSYTTRKANAHRTSVLKMQSATQLTKDKAYAQGVDATIDGEMQIDPALQPETAKLKTLDSSVAGQANVLIFPDLNAANIASKFAQILSGARAYGQILTGLSKPAAEISRGASAHDIFGAAVITAAQCLMMT